MTDTQTVGGYLRDICSIALGPAYDPNTYHHDYLLLRERVLLLTGKKFCHFEAGSSQFCKDPPIRLIQLDSKDEYKPVCKTHLEVLESQFPDARTKKL